MSRAKVVEQFTHLLPIWPKDRLRPEAQQFQRLLQSRIEKAPSPARDELAEINAATLMLDNAFLKQYRASRVTMEPASNPMLYKNLIKELDEIPERSWAQSMMVRLKHMVRWK